MSYKRLLNFSRNCATWSTKQRPTAVSTKFFNDFKVYYPNLVDQTIANCQFLDHPFLKNYCKRRQIEKIIFSYKNMYSSNDNELSCVLYILRITKEYKPPVLRRQNFEILKLQSQQIYISEYFTDCKLPIQGEFLIYAYELLEKPENLTRDKLHQAYTVACVMEAIQCFWTIGDDKMDGCKTRAGKTAWHLCPDTSNKIVNDTQLIKSFLNEMLRQNVHKSIFPEIMDVVNEMYLETDIGQFLDSTFPITRDFSKYTRSNYNRISFSKASCYAFNSPMLLALVLSNKASEESFRNVRHLCTELGSFIQINNDFTEYLEYDESKPSTTSSDFVNGTCTWTSIKALEKCNEEQMKIFKESYGSPDQEKVKRVVNLYNDMDMKKLYEQEEANRYETYLQKVRNLPADSVPSRDVFLKILEFFQGYLAHTTKFYYVSN